MNPIEESNSGLYKVKQLFFTSIKKVKTNSNKNNKKKFTIKTFIFLKFV